MSGSRRCCSDMKQHARYQAVISGEAADHDVALPQPQGTDLAPSMGLETDQSFTGSAFVGASPLIIPSLRNSTLRASSSTLDSVLLLRHQRSGELSLADVRRYIC